MPETASLGLPLLVAEQAQKHVTHNEALRGLDAIVQLSVKDRDLTAPPGSPANGDRYIVDSTATGAWAGHEDDIAAYQDGAWAFFAPNEGWRAWVDDENALLVFDAAAWVDIGSAIEVLQNLSLLGVGTTADATNPFSAKLNKALWAAKTAAEGGDGDLRYTMNKETAGDTVSLLLQRGFSGRAEIGLVGDDDLTVKVSPDGSAWVEALRIDKDNADIILGLAGSVFLIGLSAAKTNVGNVTGTPQTPTFQKLGTTGETGAFAFIVHSNTAGAAPDFRFCKAQASGGAAGASDRLGQFLFNLNDGTNYLPGAAIRAEGDGVAVSTGNVSGRLTFFTNPGGAAPSERMRIDKDGVVSHRANAQVLFDANSLLQLRSYTVATLPSAAVAGKLIYVSDGTGNKRLAVSDGTNWRFPDGNVVS